MSSHNVRIGIIGAGVAAETHARELGHVDGALLHSVFARDQAKAQKFAAAFSVSRVSADLIEFLADPNLDAVIITTPNGLHLEYALAVARAGKHLIVEKPLEIDEFRAQQIVAVCKQHDVKLFIIYQRRYSDAAAKALDDIRSGRLGKVVLVNIVDNQYRKAEYYSKDAWRGTKAVEGGGCVITQSTHMLDLAQYLLGPVRSLFALTRTAYHAIETEDVAAVTLEFDSGVIGTFSSSTAAYPGQRHMVTISGTKGSIIINGEHDQVIFRKVVAEDDWRELPKGFSFADPVEPRDYPTGGQRRQLEIIVKVLLGEGEDLEGPDHLGAVRLVDAIYRSAKEGRPVSVL
ncbi:MAG TPA: Gfo/Idh/MocA family oxidoreductase [Rhizobium sp.]